MGAKKGQTQASSFKIVESLVDYKKWFVMRSDGKELLVEKVGSQKILGMQDLTDKESDAMRVVLKQHNEDMELIRMK